MNKLELERMLMDPDGLKRLTERANSIMQKEGIIGRTEGNPAFKFKAVEPLFHEVRPTLEEITVNSEDYFIGKSLLVDIGRFIPELEKEDPKKVLSILMEKCKKDPSESNQMLVEATINRLTLGAILDKDIEKLVNEAIEILTTSKETGKQGDKRLDSISVRVYEHANYTGTSAFLNQPPPWVFGRYEANFLKSKHLHDNISSLYVEASAGEFGGAVILFEHDRFVGRYAIFPTTSGVPTQRKWYSYVGNYINDLTSSILVVRRFSREVTIPFVASYPGDLKNEIKNFVNSVSNISPRGDPIVTWDMWPSFDPRRFVYIRIPIRVDVPYWYDYDAEIRYWIFSYVDSTGILRSYVAWYGAWVEGGVKTGSILDRLMDNIPSSLGTVNSLLRQAIDIANLFKPFSRLYYLPGTASNQGHTNDDVTLVLIRR